MPENHSFYQNKHNDPKREMTSSRETGGAAVMHITLCEYNNSLIEIMKNISTYRIWTLSVKGTILQMIYAVFKRNINTQKI